MLMFDIIVIAVLFFFFAVPLIFGICQDRNAKNRLNISPCRIDKWVC